MSACNYSQVAKYGSQTCDLGAAQQVVFQHEVPLDRLENLTTETAHQVRQLI